MLLKLETPKMHQLAFISRWLQINLRKLATPFQQLFILLTQFYKSQEQCRFYLFNWHFYNAYTVPGNVLSTLQVFTCLILLTSLWGQCFYPDVTDGETEVQFNLHANRRKLGFDPKKLSSAADVLHSCVILFVFLSMYKFPWSFFKTHSMLFWVYVLQKFPSHSPTAM